MSAQQLVDNGDGTVTNIIAGLMWTKATLNQFMRPQTTAIELCSSLDLVSYRDWRLPTIEELLPLVCYSRYGPAIDAGIFPDTRSSTYWTSSTTPWSKQYAFVVDFRSGFVIDSHRAFGDGFVRAVRSLSAGG